jgi:hypothetical protein
MDTAKICRQKIKNVLRIRSNRILPIDDQIQFRFQLLQ